MNTKEKILVVDDNVMNVELLEAFLSGDGFQVLKAYNGKEAVETAKKERPNLILLDILMPVMDGLQACEALRKDADTCAIPIIMVTSQEKDKDIVHSLERGADDYVLKPVVKKELLSKVYKMLSKAKEGQLPSQQHLKKSKPEEKGKQE